MDNDIIKIIIDIFHYLFFTGSFLAVLSYVVLSIISAVETIEYVKKNSFVNYNHILSSPISPSITIIAPAYNESLNVVENVRSLLSNHYPNYNVIIVNDGSSDDSLEKLIEAYDLEHVEYVVNEKIKTQPFREGVFKSKNPAFEKLIVVDKENGGKADALNMGLNISESKYVACIDVDCLLLEDALQKMIKPFMEATDHKVIAAGGVIRIANSCVIKGGKLIEVNLPKNLIVQAQILEYLRAFLLGRMAWSRLNGLLVISGAFGIFEKETAIKVGGYDTATVGEDMEIIVRMRRYMEEQNKKYKVAYIPDPLCWTEAPDNYKTLISQRNRWTRGTIETLRKHRKIAFNKNYGKFGLLSYPYWLFFERLAPVVEVTGIIYFGILIAFNLVHWQYAVLFIALAYLFSVLFSIVALYSEELTYNQYKKKGAGYKLILLCFIEPIILHPIVLYAAIRGNIDYYFNKKKKWGAMERKGMTAAETS
ncbi:cellulose synthase/poly-beta-1,6-N-acetylglucosamine synthase-like glycosyltransferase [Oceanihabitans sediminis]|uniref:Glycosyltransferase family 2 protein n=1 Tax=Oceanihabitans sediminis TaxID=1812012 RepID=A0A368P7W3_9FLAO|nr:glycosyltransferase [Oceanihabitans sediminis]MDX1772549.1 glycosyltransferase [Oceanihabitans sediminis]RBP34198.1 cellulose synthase/poly-beta-1,6-N-acetylglucosamine synthase-like glycosyltransferase [Oceanihabitans sediminis]RCU57889.1 glycosyltransferase family 2 protein [Oceanihabitans sediminis]